MSELRRAVFILALAVLMLGIAVLLLAVRPAAQDAPTPSQGGAGRPEAPGVAPMSTSAPRSAPETPLSRPRVFAPVAAQGSGTSQERTGAPTEVRVKPPAERRLLDRQEGAPLFARTGIGTAAGAIRGVASYYGTGPAGVAAAGPNLRAALGRNWRGTWVRVSYRGRSAWLRLGDACWCQVADIDIPTRTFSYLSRGELWRGLLRVTISWGGRPALPATDTAP